MSVYGQITNKINFISYYRIFMCLLLFMATLVFSSPVLAQVDEAKVSTWLKEVDKLRKSEEPSNLVIAEAEALLKNGNKVAGLFLERFDEGYDVKKWADLNKKSDIVSVLSKMVDTDPLAGLEIAFINIVGLAGVESDYTLALKILHQHLDDDVAKVALGYMYFAGLGVEKDVNQAVELFKSAAEVGNGKAMNYLGFIYVNGLSTESFDYENGLKWLKKAAGKNIPDAQNTIGSMYLRGLGVPQDDNEAARWFKLASDQGYLLAMNNLGLLHLYGLDGKVDFAEAYKLFLQAAERGELQAQLNLAQMFANGNGVKQSYKKAKVWLDKAADGGNPGAWINLGNMYLNGLGVKVNYPKARDLFIKAAEAGYPMGKTNLGYMLVNGYGVEPNDYEALKLFKEAYEDGELIAAVNLGDFYRVGRGGLSVDPERAISLYRLAADDGSVEAQYRLGTMYENGEGVSADLGQAKEWYELAAKAGHNGASESLKRLE